MLTSVSRRDKTFSDDDPGQGGGHSRLMTSTEVNLEHEMGKDIS